MNQGFRLHSSWLGRLLVVLRVWGAIPLSISAAISLLVWWFVVGPVSVPGGGEVEVAPLVPALCTAVVPLQFRISPLPIEQLSLQPPWIRRLQLICMIVGVTFLVAVVGVGTNWVVYRNLVMLTGIAFMATAILPLGMSWMPSILYPIVTWLLGSPAFGENAPVWAVLFHPMESKVALVVTFFATGGFVLYTVGVRLVGGT